MRICSVPFGRLLTGVALLAAGFTTQSASAYWLQPSGKSIVDIVAASGGEFDNRRNDFDILLQAVTAAGLGEALADPEADLTVFAPNDLAFIRLANDLGYRGHDEEGAFDAIVETLTLLGGGDPIPLLTSVLLYHVSPEAKSYREIRHQKVIETLLDGAKIVPVGRYLLDADPDLDNPFIRYRFNRRAANGIIHTVSRVLIPVDLPNTDSSVGSIADIVSASGGRFDRNFRDYDLLLNAVQAAGLGAALADLSADLTVFAPTDIAFIRLARALGYDGWREQDAFEHIVMALTELGGGDPIPLLTQILLYHVSPGSKVLKDVILSESLTTLLEDATIQPDGRTLRDAAGGLRDPWLLVFASDIRASNGLIHSINRVLIPLDL